MDFPGLFRNPNESETSLRDVSESDLEIFYEHQLDPEATGMAVFPSRDYDAFMAHWQKGITEKINILQTIIFRGEVAGNIVSWEPDGKRKIGYWLGREYWGQGIASAALHQFIRKVRTRPLYAHVAKKNAASIRVLRKCGFTVTGEGRIPGFDGEEFVLTLRDGNPSEMEQN